MKAFLNVASLTGTGVKNHLWALMRLPAAEQTELRGSGTLMRRVRAPDQLWELLVNLLDDQLIHLLGCGAPFFFSRVFLLPENPLQRPLQVGQAVLVLQVVC